MSRNIQHIGSVFQVRSISHIELVRGAGRARHWNLAMSPYLGKRPSDLLFCRTAGFDRLRADAGRRRCLKQLAAGKASMYCDAMRPAGDRPVALLASANASLAKRG